MDQPTPSVTPALTEAPNTGADERDPQVKVWSDRIVHAKKHWKRFHDRVRHNRKVVRGIDDNIDVKDPKYNRDRANLIQSTLTVVLSRIYAKNPEMSAEPTNKAQDLRLFCDTISRVTQVMLESAKLKQKAKATVRAAMTCSFGVVKLQYQRDLREDPIIKARIEDAQENIARIDSLLAQLEDPLTRGDEEAKRAELQRTIEAMAKQLEVVAAEGLVIDRVRTERLIVDPAVEDIWEYESADWLVEEIPMRRSKAMGLFKGFDLTGANTYKVGTDASAKADVDRPRMYSAGEASGDPDPIVLVHECWSKVDNTIYTLVEGCNKQFARKPYSPPFAGERWYPYFLLPFQSVDGEFVAQSLVDLTERLQVEHNETRDKYAELRSKIRPYFIASGELKDKDIKVMVHPELGEMVVVDTQGAPIGQMVQVAPQLQIDPQLFDTAAIRQDWELVSGLQDAARSIVVQSKTATEAAISDQALAARVSEFRDQVEDFLTEMAQYASELCLLAMTDAQVETIMGKHQQVEETVAGPLGPMVVPKTIPAYVWPAERRPETVFNLVQMKIRAGSTSAPNKLQMQENWSKAVPLIEKAIMAIRAIEGAGGDASAERELVRETIARFDESIDVDRFLPPKPMAAPMAAAPGLPVPGGITPPQALAPEPVMEPAGMAVGGRPMQVPVQ
jgi:hypothetical protein